MPDSGGKLSDEEADRCINWVNEKASAKDDACSVCGSPDNYIDDRMLRVQSTPDASGLVLSVPLVFSTCRNCGYTRFFNAGTIGLVSFAAPTIEGES
jgi:predicted nucleic-acid-binding Zn-ribbon protein